VGEWRASGERKACLSKLPLRSTRRDLAGAIKACWVCEQTQEPLKEALGLGHLRAAPGPDCTGTR